MELRNIVTFNIPFEGKMKGNVKDRWSISANDAISIHVPDSARQSNNAQAVDSTFFGMVQAIHNGSLTIGKKGRMGIAEYRVQDKTYIATAKIYRDKYRFSTTIIDEKGNGSQFKGNDLNELLTLKGATIGLLYDKEIKDNLTFLLSVADTNVDDEIWEDENFSPGVSCSLCILSSNLYYRLLNLVDIYSPKLEIATLKKLKAEVIHGQDFTAISGCISTTSLKGAYPMDPNRVLTAEEQMMVPDMPDNYVFPAWTITTARDIAESNGFSEKIRNILLIGPSGTGKTQGARAIASLLGLPYVKFSCSHDTDIFDLVGTIIPETEGMNSQDVIRSLGLPTFEDVEYDFENAYQKLFGKKPNQHSTAAECYDAITKTIIKAAKDGKDGFIFVESNILKGAKNGWVIEMQEADTPKKSVVLAGINALYENEESSSVVTTPTGQTIKKHPHTVFILTGNGDYDGCNPIQQSVLSRMNIIRKINAPTAEELTERTLRHTGLNIKYKPLVHKMAKTILGIAEYCKEQSITDGVCGPRELNDWCKKAIMLAKRDKEDGDDDAEFSEYYIIKSIFSTIFNKISQVQEDIEAVLIAKIQKEYDSDEIAKAKLEYEQGLI